MSAHDGLWQRLEQVLLGALPASSSPIRVSHHFIERPEKITARILGDFRRAFPSLSIVPMRQFDGKTGTVVLPGRALYGETASPIGRSAEDQRERDRQDDRRLSWGLGS